MREVGIDISHQTSKALADFQPEDFDVVISLCGVPKAAIVSTLNLQRQWHHHCL